MSIKYVSFDIFNNIENYLRLLPIACSKLTNCSSSFDNYKDQFITDNFQQFIDSFALKLQKYDQPISNRIILEHIIKIANNTFHTSLTKQYKLGDDNLTDFNEFYKNLSENEFTNVITTNTDKAYLKDIFIKSIHDNTFYLLEMLDKLYYTPYFNYVEAFKNMFINTVEQIKNGSKIHHVDKLIFEEYFQVFRINNLTDKTLINWNDIFDAFINNDISIINNCRLNCKKEIVYLLPKNYITHFNNIILNKIKITNIDVKYVPNYNKIIDYVIEHFKFPNDYGDFECYNELLNKKMNIIVEEIVVINIDISEELVKEFDKFIEFINKGDFTQDSFENIIKLNLFENKNFKFANVLLNEFLINNCENKINNKNINVANVLKILKIFEFSKIVMFNEHPKKVIIIIENYESWKRKMKIVNQNQSSKNFLILLTNIINNDNFECVKNDKNICLIKR